MNSEAAQSACPFCQFIRTQQPVAENCTFFARYDKYPVSPGHILLIPRRHMASLFDLNEQERQDFFDLLLRVRCMLDERFHPDGYNIGVNNGLAAGQTVMHLHIHVIPRHFGDVDNPRGGVRGVIPELTDYRLDNGQLKSISEWPIETNPINHDSSDVLLGGGL